MARRSNLTVCGICSRWVVEFISPPASRTKGTVSLASSLRTHKSRRKYRERTHPCPPSKGVVPARACAHRAARRCKVTQKKNVRCQTLSIQDQVEPVKHPLEKYLACARFAVAST